MLKNNKLARVKLLAKVILVLYLLTLLWLLLFKTSFDFMFVLEEHQVRVFNIVPFMSHLREMAENLLIFIPFGLLLGVNFKQITFRQKLIVISIFSIVIEAIQFILAIGITDVTDVIMNTSGGLLGLVFYNFGRKRVNPATLDYFINIVILILIILFLVFRFFILRVKY